MNQTVWPYLFYPDVDAASEFLQRALDFLMILQRDPVVIVSFSELGSLCYYFGQQIEFASEVAALPAAIGHP